MRSLMCLSILSFFILSWDFAVDASQKCQVCIEAMTKLQKAVDDNNGKDPVSVVDDTCATFTGKLKKICSNIGALPNSPTRIVSTVAKQLTASIPPEKICTGLARTDPQICEIAHQFVPDREADFKKMTVKQLKQTLEFMGIECAGCMDKSDFVDMAEKNRDKLPHGDL